MINLYNIDCMEYMREQSDNAFDLAICDPPYGHGNDLIRKGKNRGDIAPSIITRTYNNSAPPSKSYFDELKRVSKNQIIWGANHFANMFNSSSACWIVWDKDNGSTDQADCEIAYTSFKGAARLFKYTWNGMHQGGYGGNTRLNEKRINPTQKPIALYSWLLNKFAKQGDRVFDSHLGSGSHAIAAHYYGVDFVGCEKDEIMLNEAKKWIGEGTRQEVLI